MAREVRKKSIIPMAPRTHRGGCPLSRPGAPVIDYKDVRLLSRYVSEKGRMVPSRISNVSQKKQRLLSNAIKRARFLALMPYVVQ